MNNKEVQKMIEDYAFTYAQMLILYGVDISNKYENAVEMEYALSQAYHRGFADGYAASDVKCENCKNYNSVLSNRLDEWW
jgi:hypothetical protein